MGPDPERDRPGQTTSDSAPYGTSSIKMTSWSQSSVLFDPMQLEQTHIGTPVANARIVLNTVGQDLVATSYLYYHNGQARPGKPNHNFL